LVYPNLLGYVCFSLEQIVEEVPLYHKWLQRVHKPLHSRLKETLLKERTIKAHKGLLHKGEELHNDFTQFKTRYALNSRLTIDTQ